MEQQPTDNPVAEIYIPYRNRQCLVYDLANITCVETIMKICDVRYEIKEIVNANFLSSSGYVPLVRYDTLVMDDYMSMAEFFRDKLVRCPNIEIRQSGGSILPTYIDENEGSSTYSAFSELTMCCMIKELEDFEKFVCWIDQYTYKETKCKYSAFDPFPLNHILPMIELQKIKTYLNQKGLIKGLTSDDILKKIITIVNIFSLYLKDSIFLLGRKPSAIDALLFGHLTAILSYHNSEGSNVFRIVANYILNNNALMAFVETLQKLTTRL